MTSILTDDFRDFITLFLEYDVDFLVCGGHAVGFHGYPRLTMDFDLLINPSKENAAKTMRALDVFGFGNAGIPKTAFLQPGTAVTLGVQPNQIDLLTSVGTTLKTEDVFANAVPGLLEDFNLLYISKEDLIACKRAAGRAKDLADIEELEKM